VDSSGLGKAACDLAKDLLVRSDAYKGITCELLEKYLHLDKTTRPQTAADLFDQLSLGAERPRRAGLIG